MKRALLFTSHGNTLGGPNKVVSVIGELGSNERYVYELKAGDRLLFLGQYAPNSLEEIVGVLYDVIPDYARDRKFVFIRDELEGTEYEIPRLRYDLVSTLFKTNPELFSQAEQAVFHNLLFRSEGKDFSLETHQALARELGKICRKAGLDYKYNSRMGWLQETYHVDPNNLENAVRLAQQIGNANLLERSQKILELPREDNPYFELTDSHRRYRRMLAELSEEGKQKEPDTNQTPKERVHPKYLEWDAKVLEQFRARKHEKILEATFYGMRIVEGKEAGRPSAKSGFSKGVIFIDDKSRALYDRLKLAKKPASRTRQAAKSIQESCSILAEIYQLASEHLTELEEQSLKILGYKRDYIRLRLDKMDYISPVYGYTADSLLGYLRWRQKNTLSLLTEPLSESGWRSLLPGFRKQNQPGRLAYRKQVKDTLPEGHPLRAKLSRLYEKCMYAQLRMSQEGFVDAFSTQERHVEKMALSYVARMNAWLPASQRIFTTGLNVEKWYQKSTHLYNEFYRNLLDNKKVNKLVGSIAQIDRMIPPEIVALRRPSVVEHIWRHSKKSELWQVARMFCQAYGLETNQDFYVPFVSALTDAKDYVEKQTKKNTVLFANLERNFTLPSLMDIAW